MRTWFGDFDDDGGALAGRTIEALAKWAESSDSRELTRGIGLQSLAIKNGLCASPEEYRRLLHETSVRVAKDGIAGSLAGKDAYAIQAVKSLDDMNEALNIFSERLAEWYGIHFPELRMRPNDLADFVLAHGAREASGHPAAAASIGAPMAEEDIAAVRGIAVAARTIFYERNALEGYVRSTMKALAPNLSGVLGPVLGARMIARAGSLEKLAKMPASGIQVMGAGEALFKHLKAGTPSPKHGLIYKHPLVSGAPKKARGKIARMLAGKAAIAARVDYYSGEVLDFGDLKEKAAAIRAKGRKGP